MEREPAVAAFVPKLGFYIAGDFKSRKELKSFAKRN